MIPWKRRRRNAAAQEGAALVVGLAILVTLVVSTGAMLTTLVSYHREAEDRAGRSQAQCVAANGAHEALYTLGTDPDFGGELRLQTAGGTAVVTVTQWEGDGLDNDGNGLADDAGEDQLVGVISRGFVNAVFDAGGNLVQRPVRSYRSGVDAVVRKLELDFAYAQTVYVDDAFASLDFNGNSFLVSGNDTNLDGTPGPQPPRHALGVPSDPLVALSQIAPWQMDNFVGATGPPSLAQTTAVDLQSYIDQLVPLAHLRWPDAQTSFTGEIGSRDPLVPVIAHAQGDLEIHGSTTGTGVLLVEGDLEITGSFDFAGVVVVMGSVQLRGGGNKRILGSLLTLGQVQSGDDFEISGNVSLAYSSEAMSVVTAAARVALVSWIPR